MITNYLKLGYRNLLKNRLASFINISGLAMAIGCCLVVFVFMDWFFNQDDFHTNRDRLYVVERIMEKDGNQSYFCETPAPLGTLLKKDFPQITQMTRIEDESGLIKQGDNIFKEKISFVDNSFYTMLDFPIKWGTISDFADQNGIVLSEELSTKLFGNENSIGKNVHVFFNKDSNQITENFTVKGVLKSRPRSASFYFSAIAPLSKLEALGIFNANDWNKMVSITFLETKDKHSILPSKPQCKDYLNQYNESNKDNKISAFHFQPLRTMHAHSYLLNSSPFANTHPVGLILLGSIALGILLLVCFNYMNIAIASASGRLREIGVRKVLGSERRQIIIQFLIENLITCFIGVALGLILARTLFIPWFSKIASDLDLVSKLFSNPRVWIALITLMVISVLGGAAYPALYISGLKPISIVRGKLGLGNRNGMRKVLLGFQFFITFLGISMALAFIREQKISKAKPWGYTPANTVTLNLSSSKNYDLLKSEILSNNSSNSITASVQPLGRWNNQMVIRNEGKDQTVNSIQALGGFVSFFKIRLIQGRDLSESSIADLTSSVLVNHAFLKANHWASAVGKSIEYQQVKYNIVGEVNDFRYESFEHAVAPLVIMACSTKDIKYAYIQSKKGWTTGAHTYIESIWKKILPDVPFEYRYQDNVFDNYYVGFTQVIQILSAAAFIMIFVSICGIFGLALLILSKKMKDISIRKVLGAGDTVISYQILKEFLFAMVMALLIAMPLSWLFTHSIFNLFTPESKVSYIPLMYALIAIVSMTLLSVSWHLYKAIAESPIKSLRAE